MAKDKKKGKRSKLNWMVIMLVSTVAAFCVLTTLEDKYELGLGLPEIHLPSLSFLYDYIDGVLDEQDSPEGQMDNALAVSGSIKSSEGVTVHMLDVGQADSILIRGPDADVLIDAGENDQGGMVIKMLRDLGVTKLDAAIGTHPHSDHIGGLDTVLSQIPVKKIILPEIAPEIVPTTKTYTDLLRVIDEENMDITVATPGMKIALGDGAMLEIFGPIALYGDLNNSSVITKLTYGSTSMLFCGDVSAQAESSLVSLTGIKADVLQIPHHGSDTSSTAAFLDAVSPRIGLISCGIDNSYGHPSRKVMERLEERDIKIYRTDLMGAITVQSDGERVFIRTER